VRGKTKAGEGGLAVHVTWQSRPCPPRSRDPKKRGAVKTPLILQKRMVQSTTLVRPVVNEDKTKDPQRHKLPRRRQQRKEPRPNRGQTYGKMGRKLEGHMKRLFRDVNQKERTSSQKAVFTHLYLTSTIWRVFLLENKDQLQRRGRRFHWGRFRVGRRYTAKANVKPPSWFRLPP